MSRIRPVMVALVVLAALAPAAHANSFQDIYKSYAATGTIDACKFTSKQLADARKQVPSDIAQYAPDFPDALDAAAQQRASGGCKSTSSQTGSTTGAAAGGATTTTTPAATTGAVTPATTGTAPPATTAAQAAPTTTPQPTPSPQPAPVAVLPDAAQASSPVDDSGGSSGVLLLVIIGGLMLAAVASLGAARWWAYDPPWVKRTRHSVAEAGWRASAAWAEFRDWVRFGR